MMGEARQPTLGGALPRTVYCVVPVWIHGSTVEVNLMDDGAPYDGYDCWYEDESLVYGGEWGKADDDDIGKAWGLLSEALSDVCVEVPDGE